MLLFTGTPHTRRTTTLVVLSYLFLLLTCSPLLLFVLFCKVCDDPVYLGNDNYTTTGTPTSRARSSSWRFTSLPGTFLDTNLPVLSHSSPEPECHAQAHAAAAAALCLLDEDKLCTNHDGHIIRGRGSTIRVVIQLFRLDISTAQQIQSTRAFMCVAKTNDLYLRTPPNTRLRLAVWRNL